MARNITVIPAKGNRTRLAEHIKPKISSFYEDRSRRIYGQYGTDRNWLLIQFSTDNHARNDLITVIHHIKK